MLSLHSPAKINWFLKVLCRRADGYHNIHTVMQMIDIKDILYFEKIPEKVEIETDLNFPVEENLIYKATHLLKTYTDCSYGAKIRLIKNIPLDAGLGGGSSNAATTLMGLNNLWGTDLNFKELAYLASQLGSDIPFFLYKKISAVKGRGEIITPLRNSIKKMILLVIKPAFGVNTPLAYKNLNNYSEKDETSELKLLNILERGMIDKLSEVLSNDLEIPVFKLYPELKGLKDKLYAVGAKATLLCGSGSSIFGAFPDRSSAIKASESFKGLWHKVTETI